MDISMVSPSADATAVTNTLNNLIILSCQVPGTETNGYSVVVSTQPPVGGKNIVKVLQSSVEERFKGFKTYRCSECHMTNDSPSSLYKHMASVHKGFTIQKSDGSHILDNGDSSPDERPAKVQSPNSRVVYVMKSSKTARENGERCYKCSACGYASDSTSNIYKHMKSRHRHCVMRKLDGTISKPETVDNNVCVSDGQVVRVIKATKEEVAKGDMLYRCSACDKSSNATSNLYQHMEKAHKGCRIERINQLDTAIPRGQSLEANAFFNDASSKIVRIVKSSEEEMARGEKQYKCSECGKGGNCTGNLYAHMDVSHPECVVQLVKAANNSTVPLNSIAGDNGNVVKIIAATHNGKALYKCSQCCMVAKSTSNLYKHMRRQHKGFFIIKKSRKSRNGIQGSSVNVNNRKINDSYSTSPNVGNDVGDDIGKILGRIQGSLNSYSTCLNVDNGVGDDNGKILGRIQGSQWFGYESNTDNVDIEAYECSVCMETFSNCNDLDIHVKLHDGDDSNGSFSSRNSDVDNGGGILGDSGEVDGMEFEEDGENLGNDVSFNEENHDGGNVNNGNSITQSGLLNNPHNVSCKESLHISMTDENMDVERSEDCRTVDMGSIWNSLIDPSIALGSHQKFTVAVEDPASVSGHSKTVTIVKSSLEERKKGEEIYRCSRCDKASNFTSNLYRHMERNHKGFHIEKITESCKSGTVHERTTSVSAVGVGPTSSSKKIVKVIITPACERVSGYKKYNCSVCGLGNDSTSNLYKHMRCAHRGYVIHKLKEGGSNVPQNPKDLEPNRQLCNDIVRIIRLPQSRHNERERTFQCSKCGFESSVMASVYSHIRSDHRGCVIERMRAVASGSPPPPSNLGGNAKTVRVIKTSYLDRSRGVKTYQCSRCPYLNNSTSNLYKHMRICHADCVIERLKEVNEYYDICNSDASLDADVVRVIKIPNKGGPLYKCSKCDQSSNNTSNLYKHMQRCHPEFNILKKIRATSLGRIRRESISHSLSDDDDEGEDYVSGHESTSRDPNVVIESYECSVCMETFLSCNDLDAHTQTQHPG